MLQSILNFLETTGVAKLFETDGWWKTLVMIGLSFVLIYFAIVKKYEPLLLLPIAIGMLLTNLPGAGLFHLEMWIDESGTMKVAESIKMVLNKGGFLDLLYIGVKLGIYPCIIFMGIGAMTDFSPLISNPKSLLIGAGAQFGVFVAFSGALISGVFSLAEAASIGIIGGADGPTAILVTKTLAPSLLGGIQLYGSYPDDTASAYEALYHKEGAQNKDVYSASGIEDREDPLPDNRNRSRRTYYSRCTRSYRMPYVW